MVNKINNKLLLYIWLVYSISTLLMYEYGFFIYKVYPREKILLYVYLFFVHISVIVGYILGVKSFHPIKYFKRDSKTISFLNIYIIFSLFFAIITTYFFINEAGFSLDFDKISLTERRNIFIESYQGTALSHLMLFNNLFLIIAAAVLASRIHSLSIYNKIVLLIIISMLLLVMILSGGRHGLYNAILIFMLSLHIAIVTKRIKLPYYVFVSISIAILTIFLVYTSLVAKARLYKEYTDEQFSEIMKNYTKDSPFLDFNENHPLLAYIPRNIEGALIQGSQYFSYGYYGLGVALNKDFNGISLGAGHSSFIMRNLLKIGVNLSSYSYFDRLIQEDGFSPSDWITCYPWFASDVTFIGTIPLLFFLAFIMGRSWMITIYAGSFLSAIVLICMFYLFMNMTSLPPFDNYVTILLYYISTIIFLIKYGFSKPIAVL